MFQRFSNLAFRSRDFIVRIRNSDERTRKRWLIIFTIPAFALVILLWLLYMGAVIGSKEDGRSAPEEVGFFETLGVGFRVVGERIGRGAERVREFLRERLSGPTISIDAAERNFIAEIVEVVPPTPLP